MKYKKPTRVIINQPSTSQTFHNLHGIHGIAIAENVNPDYRQEVKDIITVYFVEGSILSIKINKLCLDAI
jgi:hypothetical protein